MSLWKYAVSAQIWDEIRTDVTLKALNLPRVTVKFCIATTSALESKGASATDHLLTKTKT